MTLRPSLRWMAAATLAVATWLALQPDAEPAAARALPTVATAPTKVPQVKPWPQPHRSAAMLEWPLVAPSAVAAWEPPPLPLAPKAVASAASSAPEAPPFPYTWIGRLEERGVSRALLAGATRTIDAKAGDLIDGQWRVESVRPDGLQLVWVPGGVRQSLNYSPT